MNPQALAAYGALGFPLAFAAMTAYVVAPHLYGTQTSLSLATIGTVLLLTRLTDGLLDPWLGRLAGEWDAQGQLARRLPLAGVLSASLLAGAAAHTAPALAIALLAVTLVAGIALLLMRAPQPQAIAAPAGRVPWSTVWRDRRIRRLLAAYTLSATASSIAATLVAFYIADQLQAPAATGVLLVIYFLAGAGGLPMWGWLADRLGAARAWRWGMFSACLAFCWAGWLGAGDLIAYGLVCLLAGLSLGADLALPPVLLTTTLPADAPLAAWFGVWGLLTKLSLAAASLALPLLGLLGYVPGTPATSPALAATYAGLPCLLKLLAVWLAKPLAETRRPPMPLQESAP
jgi:Na+/melibiose symporter-like transporter